MASTEDRPLPDDIIEHIFSFLPTRDVVKTCVLSRRWRSYWTTVPDLRFSVSSHHDSFVDRILRLYGRGKVRKFHLDFNSEQLWPSNIDSWVGFAIDHEVEELRLNLNICYDYNWLEQIPWGDYTLSPLLYNCSSLTRLVLRGCLYPSCESISWSSLKSLSIDNVTGDVLQKILMSSPVLEYLTLERFWAVEEINSRSLRELVIDASLGVRGLRISTPRLLSLRVRLDHLHDIIRIVEVPSLLEAELDFNGPTVSDFCPLKEMLCKLQNATRILFGPWSYWVRIVILLPDGRVIMSM
ncbi:hypothetical protein NL676_008679 [Syzygium grande]|nr:hypothetical protein NL676_008679 [Syzygium grande]